MADNNSFDVVSEVDMQEALNAANQAAKEVANRFDLKKAGAEIAMEGEEITVEAADEFNVKQAIDVLQTRMSRRGVDLKSLRIGDVEDARGGRSRAKVTFQQGIPTETAKKIVASIKKLKMKVQASIQGETVRVSGKKRDDLQTVITHLKGMDLDIPLTFTNYRG